MSTCGSVPLTCLVALGNMHNLQVPVYQLQTPPSITVGPRQLQPRGIPPGGVTLGGVTLHGRTIQVLSAKCQ